MVYAQSGLRADFEGLGRLKLDDVLEPSHCILVIISVVLGFDRRQYSIV